jgi:hypothetical protein
VHEFGFQELLDVMSDHGFERCVSRGVMLTPYWAVPNIWATLQNLVNNDVDLNEWSAVMGRTVDPQFAFCQTHTFRLKR